MKLRFTPRALADISEIHDYVANHNHSAATAVIARVRATATLVAEYPGLGRDTDIPHVRIIAVGRFPYLIYHRVGDDEVAILHIRHGARASPAADDF